MEWEYRCPASALPWLVVGMPDIPPQGFRSRVSFRAFVGDALDALCGRCANRRFAMDDGALKPAIPVRLSAAPLALAEQYCAQPAFQPPSETFAALDRPKLALKVRREAVGPGGEIGREGLFGRHGVDGVRRGAGSLITDQPCRQWRQQP